MIIYIDESEVLLLPYRFHKDMKNCAIFAKHKGDVVHDFCNLSR